MTADDVDGATRLPVALVGFALPVELAWDGTLVAQVDDGLDASNWIQLFVPPDALPGSYGLYL